MLRPENYDGVTWQKKMSEAMAFSIEQYFFS
jgi:hypothetical protein